MKDENKVSAVRRISGLFDSYNEARSAFEKEIRSFGCTRLEWGFGKWLWMPVVEGEDVLGHWRRLQDIKILTNAGQKALERAERMAAHFPSRAAEFGVGVAWQAT